jgi:DNA topoisomerase-1
VRVHGSRIRFRFNGKSGKAHDCEVDDRRVARLVRVLLVQPGPRLFKFHENGEVREVRRQHINAYIKEVMGEKFSAKDFRTWAGTAACACALARIGCELTDSPAQVRRKIVAAVKETALALGNTPAVCRSAYISPNVLQAYEEGRVIQNPLQAIGNLATRASAQLHRCEQSLLRLLERSANGSQMRAGASRKRRLDSRLAA